MDHVTLSSREAASSKGGRRLELRFDELGATHCVVSP